MAPTAKRVAAVTPAKTAGAAAVRPPGTASSSARNTAPQEWWAFSTSSASAAIRPVATSGRAQEIRLRSRAGSGSSRPAVSRTGHSDAAATSAATTTSPKATATAFLAGIAEVCTEHGLGLPLIPISGGAADVQRVREAAVDGFVVWTTFDDNPVLAAVAASALPAAVHDGPAVENLDLVTIDNRAAAAAIGAVGLRGATRPAVLSFPVDRHRDPGLLLGPDPESAAFPVTRDRLAGSRRTPTPCPQWATRSPSRPCA